MRPADPAGGGVAGGTPVIVMVSLTVGAPLNVRVGGVTALFIVAVKSGLPGLGDTLNVSGVLICNETVTPLEIAVTPAALNDDILNWLAKSGATSFSAKAFVSV